MAFRGGTPSFSPTSTSTGSPSDPVPAMRRAPPPPSPRTDEHASDVSGGGTSVLWTDHAIVPRAPARADSPAASSGDTFATAQPLGPSSRSGPGSTPGSSCALRARPKPPRPASRLSPASLHPLSHANCPDCAERAAELAGVDVYGAHAWARASDQDFFEALQVEAEVDARQLASSSSGPPKSQTLPNFKLLAGGKVAVHRVAPTYALTLDRLAQHVRALQVQATNRWDMIVIPRPGGTPATEEPAREKSRLDQAEHDWDQPPRERPPELHLEQTSTGRSSHTPKCDCETGETDEQLTNQTRESQSLSSSHASHSLASPSHESRSLVSPCGHASALHPTRASHKSSTTKRRMPTPSSFPSESSFPVSLLSQDARPTSIGTSTIDSSFHLSPRTPGLPIIESPPSTIKTSPRKRSRRIRGINRPWALDTEGGDIILSSSAGIPAPPPSRGLPPLPGASEEQPAPWGSPALTEKLGTRASRNDGAEAHPWSPEVYDGSDADTPSLPSLGSKAEQVGDPSLGATAASSVPEEATDPFNGMEQEELEDALESSDLVTDDHLLRPTHSSSRLSTVSEAETCATTGTGATSGMPAHLGTVPSSMSSVSTSPAQTVRDPHRKPSPQSSLPTAPTIQRSSLPPLPKEPHRFRPWSPSHSSQPHLMQSLRDQASIPSGSTAEPALVMPEGFSTQERPSLSTTRQRLQRSPSLSAADYARPDIRSAHPLARPCSVADLRSSEMGVGRRRIYSLSDVQPHADTHAGAGGSMRRPTHDGVRENQLPLRDFSMFPRTGPSNVSSSGRALGPSLPSTMGMRAPQPHLHRSLRSMPSAPALTMARGRAEMRDSISWSSDMRLRRPTSTIFDHQGSSAPSIGSLTRPPSTMFPPGTARPSGYPALSPMGFSPIPAPLSGSGSMTPMGGMASSEYGEDPFSSSGQWIDPELFAMRPGRRRANSAAVAAIQARVSGPWDAGSTDPHEQGHGHGQADTAPRMAGAGARTWSSTNNLGNRSALAEPVLQDARQRFEPVLGGGSGAAQDLLSGASLQALSAQHKQQPLSPHELSLWASNFLAEYSYATEHATPAEHHGHPAQPAAARPEGQYTSVSSMAEPMDSRQLQPTYRSQQPKSYDPPPHPPPSMALPAGPGGYLAPRGACDVPMYDDETYDGHPSSIRPPAPSQWGRDRDVHSPLPGHQFLAQEADGAHRPLHELHASPRPLSGYLSDTGPMQRPRSASHLSTSTAAQSVPTAVGASKPSAAGPTTGSAPASGTGSDLPASSRRALKPKRSMRSFASTDRLRAFARPSGHARQPHAAPPPVAPPHAQPDLRPMPAPHKDVPAPGGAFDPQTMDLLPFEAITASAPPRKKGFLGSLFRRKARS